MSIKKIYLFLPPFGQYGVTEHFTREFAKALEGCGVQCKLLQSQRENPKPFLDVLFQDPPDCTLSFNGLLPDEEGRFLSDLIQIPHVACLVDAPSHFFALTKSKFTIINCVDRYFCDFFRGFNLKNVIFLPHGVESSLHASPEQERSVDILLIASCIDYETIRDSWKDKYSPELRKALEQAVEVTLFDPDTSFIQAFVDAIDSQIGQGKDIDPRKINFQEVLDELETYVRGKDRVDLIRSIQGLNVQIVGGKKSKGVWNKYLGARHPHIKVQDAVPFEEALEWMKKSKIVLNSTPHIKNGTHERILSAISCGALVLTSESRYMRETFVEGSDILFYQSPNLSRVTEKLQSILKDERKRCSMVEMAQRNVQENHTWDRRARDFISHLEPILHSYTVRTAE